MAELDDELDGKTVVSAEHGELLGERTSPIPAKAWSHPQVKYVQDLPEVPWYINEGESKCA